MTDNNDGDVDEDLVIDRSHIGCDCCGKPGPTKSCSRCLSYYYCNRECQVNHWKEHKQHCAFIKDRCDRYNKRKRYVREFLEEKENGKRDDKEPAECAICLEEIELPISLECGHVFCVSCLMQYHSSHPKKSSCPNCRGDMDELNTIAVDQGLVYCERANRSEGAEREVYVNLTLRQIDTMFNSQVVDVDGLTSDEQHKIMLQCSLPRKADVLGELNMHREVIETVDEFLNLCANSEYTEFIDKEKVLDQKISKAKAHLKLEEWQTALDMFRPLYEDVIEQQHLGFCSCIAAGISRAQYELQNYYEAIIEGDRAAWRINRHHAGVHKYIALSQMKLGDIAAAKKSITRGILHEVQWNEDNKKENEEVLRMILAKEAKNNKSKGKKKGKKKKGRGKK